MTREWSALWCPCEDKHFTFTSLLIKLEKKKLDKYIKKSMECLCYGIKHWLVKNKKFFKITKQNRFNIEIHFIQACERRKGRSHRGCFSRIKRHLYDFWNVVDLLSYGLLITALTIRHLIGNETHVFARNVFALSLLVMYLRFLEVFLIYRILGPTLMMIKEMVFFLSINVIKI